MSDHREMDFVDRGGMDLQRHLEEEKARLEGEQERLQEVSELLNNRINDDRDSMVVERILKTHRDRGNGSVYQGLRESKQFLPDEKHRHILQVKGIKKRLPDAILARKATLGEENYMFGGIFPEIHRAWITIDQTLYLWNYLDGSQYEVYDNLDHIILTAALVKPREGVFVDRTHWLLVLTTPLEIVVLAILFDPPVDLDGAPIPAKSRLILQPTPVCVSSDNVAMQRVVGTPDGRIFMGGRDGIVYELEYGIESGWAGTARKSRKKACKTALSNVGFALSEAGKFLGFGKLIDVYCPDDGPVKCMCVDTSRGHYHHTFGRLGLLYVLMDAAQGQSGSVLEAYAVRANCLWRIGRYDQRWLKQKLAEKVDNSIENDAHHSDLQNCTFASISVVPRHGAKAGSLTLAKDEMDMGAVHLVGVTTTGARVFFTGAYSLESMDSSSGYADEPLNLEISQVQPLPQGPLLNTQLERGYDMNGEGAKIDSTLPQRSMVSGNLSVLHTTDDAVTGENTGASQPILLAIGRDYAKYSTGTSGTHATPAVNRSTGREAGYKETVQVIQMEKDPSGIPIRVLAIQESVYPYGSNIFQHIRATLPEDEMVTQQELWPREVLILKEDGLQSYLKLRPLEWMAIYLQFPQWQQFRDEMFMEYGEDEGCAMCFTLACGDFSFLPRESVLQSINRTKIHERAIELLSTDSHSLIGRPEAHTFTAGSGDSQQYDLLGAAIPMWTKRYSHRFEGLVKYTARLLEPVWEHTITETSLTREARAPFGFHKAGENGGSQAPDPNDLQDLRLRNRDQWNALVVSLDAIIEVIERLYPASDLSPPLRHQWPQRDMDALVGYMREYNTNENHQNQIDREREAARAETRLVYGMYQMLKISREAAKLFRILCRTDISTEAFFSQAPAGQALRFPMLVSRLHQNEQTALSELTFKQLICIRKNRMAGQPLNKILHFLMQIASDAGDADYAARFVRDCPCFFGEPDQARFKAKGILEEAKKKRAENEMGYEWKTKVDDAMEEYRRVIFYVEPGEVGKFLSDLGRYADAVEVALLKVAQSLQPKEKDIYMEQAIKFIENVWQRKYQPERYTAVEPHMSMYDVDEQWRRCLDNALYFGGIQHLKDATFYYRLFESFSRLGDLGKGLLVSLAKSHSHLVDPHLYTFLEEHHLEELYRAFEQAGRFEEAALRLKFLAEETIEMREERYDKLKTVGILEGTKPPELLQQRIRWLSQAILCLQGTGIQGGSIRSLADLMQNLHDSREVLEVQQHLADEIMPIAEVADDIKLAVKSSVLTNRHMWDLLEYRLPSEYEASTPLWQQKDLYGLCLRVLALSDERTNERYTEKVKSMWKRIIEVAFARDDRRGVETEVEKWGKVFCPLHSIRDDDGLVFPLRAIVDAMEHLSHEQEMVGTDARDLESSGWVVSLLHHRVKIPHMALFNRYQQLLSDPLWQPRNEQPKKQVHLLKAIAFLLQSWLRSTRDDDINDLRVAQIDFEEFQIKLVASAPYFDSPVEREDLQRAFRDSMERRRHLNW